MTRLLHRFFRGRGFWVVLVLALVLAAVTALGYTDQAPLSVEVFGGCGSGGLPHGSGIEKGATVGAPIAFYLDASRDPTDSRHIPTMSLTALDPSLEEVDYPSTVYVSPGAVDDVVRKVAYRALKPGEYQFRAITTCSPSPAGGADAAAGGPPSTAASGPSTGELGFSITVRDRSPLVTLFPIFQGFADLVLLTLLLGKLATPRRSRPQPTKIEPDGELPPQDPHPHGQGRP